MHFLGLKNTGYTSAQRWLTCVAFLRCVAYLMAQGVPSKCVTLARKRHLRFTVTDIPLFLKIPFFLAQIPLLEKKNVGIFEQKSLCFWT